MHQVGSSLFSGGTLNIVFTIFGLVVLLAAAAAFARASFAKAQIDALRGDRDDLQKRVEILEGENTRISTELDAEKVKLVAEQGKVRILENITIGKDHLVTIERMISTHDEAVVEVSKNINQHLVNIERLLKERT